MTKPLTTNWQGMIALILIGLDSDNTETRIHAKEQLIALSQWLDKMKVERPWETDDQEVEIPNP